MRAARVPARGCCSDDDAGAARFGGRVGGPDAAAPPSSELLAYYRRRVDEFEAEREDFLQRLATIEVTHDELHKMRWQLRVKDEEVRLRAAGAAAPRGAA